MVTNEENDMTVEYVALRLKRETRDRITKYVLDKSSSEGKRITVDDMLNEVLDCYEEHCRSR